MTVETSILIIYTGGTIGMVKDVETGALKPFNFDDVYEQLPILKMFNYQIDSISFDPLIDSSDMNPDHWVKLANIIKDNYLDYDGFVVLHGSDTMSYTASALSFILGNLGKPVIITGSQLPMGVMRTDGRENLISSIEIAAAKEDDTPKVPEVAIYFENKLYRGNRAYKFHAENFNAFISGNYPLLAESGVNLKFFSEYILKSKFKKLRLHKKLDPNVVILKMFPGISEAVIDSILNTAGLRAVVLESFGSGNAPTKDWFIKRLKKAIDSGIVIVNVSQCIAGSVEMGKYETSVGLRKIGVVSGVDITTSSAVTKLMVVLGEQDSPEKVIQQFQKNWVGEISN
ncbi:MAG: asparaginase [Bacteroidales bacterium]|nr:asparaginase [Bacteroidales bacterium]